MDFEQLDGMQEKASAPANHSRDDPEGNSDARNDSSAALVTSTEQFAGRRRDRLAVLSILYARRQTRPEQPGLHTVAIGEQLGVMLQEMRFALWYLRGKKLIEITGDSELAITVAGVDYLEGPDGEAKTHSCECPFASRGAGDSPR